MFTQKLNSTVSVRNLRNAVRLSLTAAILFTMSGPTQAAILAVGNADFSIASNDGTVGGGLLGSGSHMIGAGPWIGAYTGVAGLLTPPMLQIANGNATIMGLANLSALGLSNSAQFLQPLNAQWVPNKHYVLSADVSVDSLLTLNVLATGNVGLALNSGASTHDSTRTAEVSLTPQSDGSYHLALGFDSVVGDAGNAQISLFADSSGVLGVSLLPTASFDHVNFSQAPIPALSAGAIAPADGTPQAALIEDAFDAFLQVSVLDAEGDPLSGVTVTFTAPTIGASTTLSSTTAVTDVSGRAYVSGVANGTVGTYVVLATADGVAQPAIFHLTNTAPTQPPITSTSNNDPPQSTPTGNAFACALAVKVINGSSPASGATIVFSAPATGASASLDDGNNNGVSVTTTTDANGVASVSATANATPGSFNVTATLTATSSGPVSPPMDLATYSLTNLDTSDSVFANGFEDPSGACSSL
jgi:hypothetical protein